MEYLTREEPIAKIQDIEWDDFEAKASKSQLPTDVWPTVSSFSNTSGGWILCGVAQHGKKFEIEGVENGQKIESDFNTTLRNGKFNQVLVTQNRKFVIDGKMVIGFYVPSSNLKPIWFNSPKNTFIRVGSTDQRATDLEIMALYHTTSPSASSQTRPLKTPVLKTSTRIRSTPTAAASVMTIRLSLLPTRRARSSAMRQVSCHARPACLRMRGW